MCLLLTFYQAAARDRLNIEQNIYIQIEELQQLLRNMNSSHTEEKEKLNAKLSAIEAQFETVAGLASIFGENSRFEVVRVEQKLKRKVVGETLVLVGRRQLDWTQLLITPSSVFTFDKISTMEQLNRELHNAYKDWKFIFTSERGPHDFLSSSTNQYHQCLAPQQPPVAY